MTTKGEPYPDMSGQDIAQKAELGELKVEVPPTTPPVLVELITQCLIMKVSSSESYSYL